MLLCFWLPGRRRKNLERWLRGREEFKKLERCDWVLMSWGKSGRTWLRVMLSRAYQLQGDLASDELLEQSALAALTIVIAGVVPVILLSRAIRGARPTTQTPSFYTAPLPVHSGGGD